MEIGGDLRAGAVPQQHNLDARAPMNSPPPAVFSATSPWEHLPQFALKLHGNLRAFASKYLFAVLSAVYALMVVLAPRRWGGS